MNEICQIEYIAASARARGKKPGNLVSGMEMGGITHMGKRLTHFQSSFKAITQKNMPKHEKKLAMMHFKLVSLVQHSN